MNRLISIIMYVLWAVTIVAVLAATFTDFKYEDLNTLAALFLGFSILNSFFSLSRNKK